MAEGTKRRKRHKWPNILFIGFSTLLLTGLIYVAAVLIQSPADGGEGSFVVEEEREPVTRMQPATMNDASALAQLFGAPLPAVPGYAPTGTGSNTTHDGENVRMAVLSYSGLTITAVRPASAAPLLLREGFSVSLRADVTVLNLPATLTSRGNARCAYIVNESAAYSVYAEDMTEEQFLEILSRLSWAQ